MCWRYESCQGKLAFNSIQGWRYSFSILQKKKIEFMAWRHELRCKGFFRIDKPDLVHQGFYICLSLNYADFFFCYIEGWVWKSNFRIEQIMFFLPVIVLRRKAKQNSVERMCTWTQQQMGPPLTTIVIAPITNLIFIITINKVTTNIEFVIITTIIINIVIVVINVIILTT